MNPADHYWLDDLFPLFCTNFKTSVSTSASNRFSVLFQVQLTSLGIGQCEYFLNAEEKKYLIADEDTFQARRKATCLTLLLVN